MSGLFDRDYDWHYDRNHDGEMDFFEKYEKYDELDRFAKRGYYEENSLGIDNPDDFEDDDDFAGEGDDYGMDRECFAENDDYGDAADFEDM